MILFSSTDVTTGAAKCAYMSLDELNLGGIFSHFLNRFHATIFIIHYFV